MALRGGVSFSKGSQRLWPGPHNHRKETGGAGGNGGQLGQWGVTEALGSPSKHGAQAQRHIGSKSRTRVVQESCSRLAEEVGEKLGTWSPALFPCTLQPEGER